MKAALECRESSKGRNKGRFKKIRKKGVSQTKASTRGDDRIRK
jgi:hypothetical protein